jgi:hypothetical protein
VRMDAGRHVVIVRGKQIQVAAEGVPAARGVAAERGPGAEPDAVHRPRVGFGYVCDAKTLYVHVKWLRAKIGVTRPAHGTSLPSGGLATSSNPHPDSCGVAPCIG